MRTMVENELNNISQAVNSLTVAVHNRTLEVVIEELEKKESQIEKLLDNGDFMFQTVLGDSFRRINEKRHDLYMKKWEIWNTIKMLYNMRMK